MTDRDRIVRALAIAESGGIDGAHHKQWTIDQMVRALCGQPEIGDLHRTAEYAAWVRAYRSGEDGPDTYEWSEGIAP